MKIPIVFLALMVGFALAKANSTKPIYEYESDLRDELFSGYNNDIIPISQKGTPVNVDFGVALVDIRNVDRSGHADLNTWLRLAWTDERLTWTPSNYGGLEMIRVHPKFVWKPDIALYNSAVEEHQLATDSPVSALVYSNGKVLFIPPTRLLVRGFQDGNQLNITMKFGSWTFDGDMVDIDFYEGRESIDMSDYRMNERWEVVSSSAKKNVKYYPCCEEAYPDLTFNLTLTKRN